MKRHFLLCLGFAATALTSTSTTVRAQSSNVIISCVSKLTGVSRIVAAASSCNANSENVITWNQQGAMGLQGATGPQGATGATGPTGAPGAAGGNVLLANDQLPATISAANGYAYSLSGSNATPLSLAASVLPLPNACSSFTLTATAINASGTSTANIYLVLADSSYNLGSHFLCSMTAEKGAPVSCSANLPSLGAFPSIGLYVTADGGFQGANLLTKATCTP